MQPLSIPGHGAGPAEKPYKDAARALVLVCPSTGAVGAGELSPLRGRGEAGLGVGAGWHIVQAQPGPSLTRPAQLPGATSGEGQMDITKRPAPHYLLFPAHLLRGDN